MKRFFIIVSVLIFAAAGCTTAAHVPSIDGKDDSSVDYQVSTPSPTATPLVDPYSIEALENRTYGEGELTVEYLWERQQDFVRYYITYTSDGLDGPKNSVIPEGEGPCFFPGSDCVLLM